jgi:phosphoserine phosphatase
VIGVGPPPWRLITFDLDGTLTRVHGWRPIAERAGRLPEYVRSNRRFFAGEIGEDVHLQDLLALAQGLTVSEVEEVLGRTPLVAGIPDVIATWHRRGVRVALLTHNPGYVCAWYQRRFGFDAFEGTEIPVPASGPIPSPPLPHADKVSGVRRLGRTFGVELREIVHVGDGTADAAVFPHVGAGVALNSTVAGVRAAADLCMVTDDIRGLPAAIDRLRPRTGM